MSVPTGFVTFLFTDVEGSTQLWTRDPSAMGRALEIHDRVLQAAIDDHDGYLFSKAGDGFAAAFSSPDAAVLAAIDGQKALAAAPFGDIGPLRVRMAIHAGAADEHDGDYYGPPLNRCARLLEIGNGGQIVCSGVVASMLGLEPGSGVTLHDLGGQRLRDLPGTEHVFDVSHPALAAAAGRTAFPAEPHNLPSQLTAFIGRSDALTQVRDLLDRFSLVTLTGVGGVGKTRLALEAVRGRDDGLLGGVWHVDLAPIVDPVHVPAVVAKTLGVLERPPDPIATTLLEHLQRRPMLLLLDNCEQVIDGVAKLVDGALRGAPNLRVIATSREALGISGEAVFVVAPLDAGSGEGAELSEAAALFVDRARLANNDFEPTAAVAEICRKVDGIPLAIELAAAWVRVLSPAQIGERLDDRFRLLTGGDRVAAPHHRTLLATMDWSYDQLAPAEQVLLRRLSVFRGDFALEAAMQVCGFGDLEPDTVIPLLGRLVQTSLLVPVDGSRFRMLETVRDYGTRRRTATEEEGVLERRHAEYFLHAGPRGPGGVPETGVRLEWFAFRDDEYENYRAALDWAHDADELDIAAGLTIELGNYWLNSGCCSGEGDRWLGALLDRLDRTPTPDRQRVLTFAAVQAIAAGRYEEAEALASEVEVIAAELGDRSGVASALTIRASVAQEIGPLEDAERFARGSFEISRDLQDPRTGDKLLHLVMVLTTMGHYDEAEARLDDHAGFVDRDQEAEGRLLQRMWRGVLAYHRGDLGRAERNLGDVLRALPDVLRSGSAFTHLYAAKVALAQGHAQRAAAMGRLTHELGGQLGDRPKECEALLIEAEAAADLGDLATASHQLDAARAVLRGMRSGVLAGALAAARGRVEAKRDAPAAVAWLGSSHVLMLAMGAQRSRPDQERFDSALAHARRKLGDAQFTSLWSTATAIDRADALEKVGLAE